MGHHWWLPTTAAQCIIALTQSNIAPTSVHYCTALGHCVSLIKWQNVARTDIYARPCRHAHELQVRALNPAHAHMADHPQAAR